MENVNPVTMPMDLNMKLKPNPDGNEGSQSNSFAKLLGELQFLVNVTRPDITYAVNRLAAYTANLSLQHVGALKQILWYLTGTRTHGITYSKSPTTGNFFVRYAHVAYMNADDLKLISSHVFIMAGGAIT